MSDLSETSNSLLGRLKLGDQDSWQRLEFLYKPLVIKWCRGCSIPDSDIDDLAQDIFQSIFRKIASFNRVARFSFRGWLKKVTLNRCTDFHRKSATIPDPSEVLDSISVSYKNIDESSYVDRSMTPATINEEKNLLLKQVFTLIHNEFSERDINVFCDLVGHEISVDAVANMYSISKNNVYKIKCKLLAKIKQEFRDLLEFEP